MPRKRPTPCLQQQQLRLRSGPGGRGQGSGVGWAEPRVAGPGSEDVGDTTGKRVLEYAQTGPSREGHHCQVPWEGGT